VAELGFEVAPEDEGQDDPTTQRKAILEQLKRGEIDTAAAAVMLTQVKRQNRPVSMGSEHDE